MHTNLAIVYGSITVVDAWDAYKVVKDQNFILLVEQKHDLLPKIRFDSRKREFDKAEIIIPKRRIASGKQVVDNAEVVQNKHDLLQKYDYETRKRVFDNAEVVGS